jgi:phage-related baseplate assembly protein
MPTPTPIVFPRISRSIEDIRAGLYARIDAVQSDYAARGWLPRRMNLNKGVIRGLIKIYAWGKWQIYTLFERLLKQSMPHYSAGEWLDLHAQSVGLQRKQATKAYGNVNFYRRESAGIGGNIVVPAGRIVRTLPDGKGEIYRYVTTAAAVLPTGAEYTAVPVEAEEYGSAANAGVGQISELVTPVVGIGAVANAADWLTAEGADVEDDAGLIERITLRWLGNNGVTKYAYKAWALSVPGVISVEILDQHPRGQGTVGIVVRGSAVLPTEALLERVREAIAPEAPINDDWYVVPPTAVMTPVRGVLHYVAGLGDPDLLAREAELRVLALYADKSDYPEITPLAIGQDLPLDLLTAAVMTVAGVKSVDWASPAADVPVPKDGIARLASLEFTVLAEAEA